MRRLAAVLLACGLIWEKHLEPTSGRVIRAVIAAAPNLDVRQIDQASVRLNGTKPFKVSIEDVNKDGHLDLVMRYSVRQLVDEGHLTASSTLLTVTGKRLKTGTPLSRIVALILCKNHRDCPTDDTIGPS